MYGRYRSLLHAEGLRNPRHHCCRSAFTLVEMLVVIGVIAILTALILPAIMRARVSSRRAHCANNLKQIGVAMDLFHQQHRRLPAGWLPPGGPSHYGGPPTGGFSALAQMLPYLGQENLHNKIDFRAPAGPPFDTLGVNTTAANTRISLFLCPSDDHPGRVGVGVTNYAACYSSGRGRHGNNGAFVWRTLTTGAIRDGLSNTAAFSEWIKGSGSGRDRRSDVFRLGQDVSGPDNFDILRRSCTNLNARDALYQDPGNSWPNKGEYWILGDIGRTLYDHALPPNAPTCSSGNIYPLGDFSQGAFSASSWHGGGVNLLMCGGQVRFVNNNIAENLWQAMASRAGSDF